MGLFGRLPGQAREWLNAHGYDGTLMPETTATRLFAGKGPHFTS